MRFDVQILGNASALPAYGRNPSAQLVNIHEKYFLIDCGEGVQMRMNEYNIRRGKINHIFISHLHGDHYFGLFGFLTSLVLLGRERPLFIYAPEALKSQLVHVTDYEQYPFEIHFHDLNFKEKECLLEQEDLEVYSFPLDHSIPTCGFLFKEKERPLNMKKDQLEKYQIPFQHIPAIKAGEDYVLPDGKRIPNEELTYRSLVPRSYAYCSDTAYYEEVLPFIEGVNLLYHESTFCEDAKERAISTKHSTAQEAAMIAKKAKAGKLLLGHFSARYNNLDPFKEEAQKIFPASELALEGLIFDVE